MVIFAPLIYLAFRARSRPASHKRLILLATNALLIGPSPLVLGAGTPAFHRGRESSYVFIFLMVAYDLWSIRKVHPATLWAELS